MDPYMLGYVSQLVSKLEKLIDSKFTDRAIAWEALQAPGSLAVKSRAGYNGREMPEWGNKTLATVGDAALDLTLISYMYELGNIDIGQMSTVKQLVVTNPFLEQVAKHIGLDALVEKDPSGRGAPLSQKTSATSLEAVFGAVYLDCGENRDVMQRVMRYNYLWPKFTKQSADAE